MCPTGIKNDVMGADFKSIMLLLAFYKTATQRQPKSKPGCDLILYCGEYLECKTYINSCSISLNLARGKGLARAAWKPYS